MERSEIHILVIPFPVQGHINPMLEFSKRLISKGSVKVTLITTNSALTSMHFQTNSTSTSVNIEAISDGYEDGEKNNFNEYFKCFETVFPQSLTKLIEKHSSSPYPVKFLIYDSVLPWTLKVARKLGLDGAPFFTQSCAVNSIYCLYHQGRFEIPPRGSSGVVSLPCTSMPLLGFDDLPWFVHDNISYQGVRDVIFNQFSNIEEPNWLFCNTFDELEYEIVKWMGSQWQVKTIGPTIPSIYLDKRLKDDRDYGLSLFKPNTDTCIKWLDSKGTDSVVYVSFGSLATLGEEQMEELAWGLKRSNSYFLWVVRESEEKKLPSNFIEETSDKGLVVTWSPQLQVLAHKSVGCFMTHCGWNSTLEALSMGVPMVAMPQWTDQTTNAKFVADVWEVGVRVKVNEKGIVTNKEIGNCIREIMERERGKEIRRNSDKWKEFAKEAVDDGGSSDKNIEEFVKKLACS